MKGIISKVSKLITDKSPYSKDKSDKHGEVFTPNELIYEMISKLPRDIWEDPSKTFLDPCSGKGNFPIYIVKKLFVHLQEHIVDEEERLKHIVEKQLFMAEFQRESAEFIATAFTFGKGYKVNLYVGDTLQMPEDFFDLSWEERREKYPDKVV
jgi:type I restriction-modification system DNA methylase subunit